ncbi:MAG TPA: substrate-binding domain-containing protein [Terrimicrobiaceae bacterium]
MPQEQIEASARGIAQTGAGRSRVHLQAFGPIVGLVAGDNKAFGKVAGEYLAGALKGKGDIVVFRGIPTTIDNERMEGFNSVMKNYPDVKILDAKHGNFRLTCSPASMSIFAVPGRSMLANMHKRR